MKVTYECEICGERYNSAAEAEACESQPMVDMKQGNFIDKENAHEPEVGEVVESSYPAWDWWNGDAKWRVFRERGSRFLDGYYALWVVVAKVPAGNRHEWRYILWTPSDQNGSPSTVWTSPEHNRMWANRVATEDEIAAARAAYNLIEVKRRIPSM